LFSIGAFAVIFDGQRHVLLCHRRDMDVWNLPGGRVESGELPTEAVVRETREETGLEVTVERLVGVCGKEEKDELVFAFLCRVVGGELGLSDEDDACEFFDVDAIPCNTSPKQVERIRYALEDRRQPVFCRQGGPTTRELVRQWQVSGSGTTKTH
jgi:ADP-ribose pyrophosphatase YjhB (NUDIX family)